uniref:Putative secreted protein n=1 Tax=Panstrongylus lignarius TaxID=156445 RepID=A0A224Y1A2_9HEMI
MKNSTLIILSLLIVYSECRVILDVLGGVPETADDVVSLNHPKRHVSPSSSKAETLLKNGTTKLSTNSEETTTSIFDLLGFYPTQTLEYSTIRVGVSINAKNRCPSGYFRAANGDCKVAFG